MASHSHVLVYHDPLQFATFLEWLAIYFHHSVIPKPECFREFGVEDFFFVAKHYNTISWEFSHPEGRHGRRTNSLTHPTRTMSDFKQSHLLVETPSDTLNRQEVGTREKLVDELRIGSSGKLFS